MEDLLALRVGYWNLHIIPPSRLAQLLIAAASLAYRGPLTVLDCGRQYDPTIVACALDGREEIADRIKARHAFICSEAVKLLQTTEDKKNPILVLDLLSTFYDENVQLRMRLFLLENAIQHLSRLSRCAGVAVIVYPPPSSPDSLQLFEHLKLAAPRVLTYEVPSASFRQANLF